MNDNLKQNNKTKNFYIKLIVSRSEVFNKEKNILPYSLSFQLDNFPEKKIKSINNNLQIFESPSNEYIYEFNLNEENEINEKDISHILTFNAYITSIFFIQKKIASIKIPIFINQKINGKQWYILKDNKNEGCIKLLINLEINMADELWNLINEKIYGNNNYDNNNNNNTFRNCIVKKKNSESNNININKIYNNKNLINIASNSNVNANHNNNNSNCYTHLSTNFHSIYSNSIIKRNSSLNNNSNTIILTNNKSTPVLFNNTFNNNINNINNINKSYSNLSYIELDKEKDKIYESNNIINNDNNDNNFNELNISYKETNNNLNLDNQLYIIKNMIYMKEKEIERKIKNIDITKNELSNIEYQYNDKYKRYENELLQLKIKERKLNKENQIYENKHFDLNDEMFAKKNNNFKRSLKNEINIYERNILNSIYNITINNYNNDNLLLETKMNNLLNKVNINNVLNMNLEQNIPKNNINKKEKKNSFNNFNYSNGNLKEQNSIKNTTRDLSTSSKTKKYIKNKNLIKKNTSSNCNYKKVKKSNIFNSNRNIKNNNSNLFIKKDIQSERIYNYSSNKIRLKKNNKLFNKNNAVNTIFKSNTKTNINNKNNISYVGKNLHFNYSLSKKIINSTNLSFVQKNYSLGKIDNNKKNNISMAYYSKTYKINNKKVKKYPIKLKYINNANLFDSNKIFDTEPCISMKYKNSKNLHLIKNVKNKNSSLNFNYLNSNCTKVSTININDIKKVKIYKEHLIHSRRKNGKLNWITDKENNYSQNLDSNRNNSKKKKKKEKDFMNSFNKCKNNIEILINNKNKKLSCNNLNNN